MIIEKILHPKTEYLYSVNVKKNSIVEIKQLFVSFFQIIVDISYKGRYYMSIVILKNSKGCWESNKLNILNGE